MRKGIEGKGQAEEDEEQKICYKVYGA